MPAPDAPAANLSLRKQALFAGLIVAALLLAIEGAARLWLRLGAAPRASAELVAGSIETAWLGGLRDDLGAGTQGLDLYVPDAQLFWRLRPDSALEVENAVYQTRTRPVLWRIRTNPEGFRGPAHPAPETGARPVIAAFGDSCTFGFRVDEDATYPAQLERDLRAHGLPQAAVVNYGVPGYTTFQGRRLLAEVLSRRRLDFVVLAFGANDLEADVHSDAAKAARISPTRIRIRSALTRIAVARLLMQGFGKRRGDLDRTPTTQRVTPEEFRENLRVMIGAARDAGSRVLLLDLVFVGPAFRETIRALAEQEGVAWLDGREILRTGLADLLAGRRFRSERAELDRFWDQEVEQVRLLYYDAEFYRDRLQDPVERGLLRYLMVEPVHPNVLGHRLIADEVGRQILDDGGP